VKPSHFSDEKGSASRALLGKGQDPTYFLEVALKDSYRERDAEKEIER